jgi:FAD-dependent oxidoreductase domain-containing protein 1
MLIDPTGVHFRHETADVVRVAFAAHDEPPGENLTCDDARWARDVLPPLVRRMPAFRELELLGGWAGHYEVTPDQHPIVGEHPDLAGLVLANGFSGHGLMMAPAIGRSVAELVTVGRFVSFDLARYRLERFARGELLRDLEPVI